MKYLLPVLLGLSLTSLSVSALPAFADGPRPVLVQLSAAKSIVSLGEPIVVKYKFTNTEDKSVNIYTGKTEYAWLNIKMKDSSGNSLLPLSDSKPTKGGIYTDGATVNPNGEASGYIVVSQKFQPQEPGKYYLSISTHLTYSWNNVPDEKTIDDQDFSLPITITAKDVLKLHTIAEGFRQTVLHDPDVANYQFAVKALFSMRDPDVLPVWRELTVDPNLDVWRAADTIRELARVGSEDAADLLGRMQTVAPERWSQTGYSPLNALETMRDNVTPKVTQHINNLLTDNGVKLDHPPIGSAN